MRARDPPGRMPRLYGRQDARRYDVPTTSGCTDGLRRRLTGARRCRQFRFVAARKRLECAELAELAPAFCARSVRFMEKRPKSP